MPYLNRGRLHRSVAGFFFVLLSCRSASAQSHWNYSVNEHGLREVTTVRPTELLNQPATSQLRFSYTEDSKDESASGALSLEFTVSPASKIPGFGFSFFEGPDAPVRGRKLMSVTVVKGKARSRFERSPSGWRSADVADGFVFGTHTLTKDKDGDVRQILEKILAGAESIEVAIADGIDPKKVIAATFPIGADRRHFQSMMKGLRPTRAP